MFWFSYSIVPIRRGCAKREKLRMNIKFARELS